MIFEEMLGQALAMLQRHGRVTYRMLQQQFNLDDATLEDLKKSLLYVHPRVADDPGHGLRWRGETTSTPPTDPDPNPTNNLKALIHDLQDNKYLLAVPAWFYIAGLVISNIYLRSLGIVSFDVLKIRYIAVGLLATFFFSISLIPAYVHFKLFPLVNVDTKWTTKLGEILLYWMFVFAFIAASTFMLINIAGDDYSHFGLGFGTIIPWVPYFFGNKSNLITIGFMVVPFIVPAFIIASEASGSGVRSTQEEQATHISKKIAKRTLISLLHFLTFSTTLFALSSLSSFVSELMSTTKVGDTSHGWEQFSGLAFLVGALTSLFMYTVINIGGIRSLSLSEATKTEVIPTDSPQAKSTDVIMTLTNKIFQLPGGIKAVQTFFYVSAIIALITFTIPIYSLGVYSSLPQRIGGGSAIPVQVVTPLKILCGQFMNSSMKTYLVDRTSSGTIFQLVSEQEPRLEKSIVMEVANSQIKSIIYKTGGKVSLNDCVTDNDQEMSK